MKGIRNLLDRSIGYICVALFILMTVVGTYQVSSRYIFKSPSTISEELISYSFAWMSMLAAAYIFGKRDHMKMIFFVERLSEKRQNIIGILSEVVIFIFSLLVLIKGGFSIISSAMTQTTPALGIPMGYVYGVIPISGIVICIYCILNIQDIVDNLKRGE